VAITTATYLELRPATVQAVLPGADALGFEVATLLLGVVTAVFVLGSPWLLPAVFVLVAVLHRSTLVNELEGAARTDTKPGGSPPTPGTASRISTFCVPNARAPRSPC